MNKYITISIRLLIALFFIVSSILKLISIDSFEVYIYSFNLLSLSSAFLFARIIIGFELLLGILFLLNIYIKQVAIVTIAMLLSFIFFLFYLILAQNTESCHCFGDFLDISHTSSIIKNIVIGGFVFVIFKNNSPYSYKYKKKAVTLSLISCMSIPFLISPPDTMNLLGYANKSTYNENALQEFFDIKAPRKGKQVVCFYGTGCRFCKLSSKKITVIANKAAENKSSISLIFWGDKKNVEEFFVETNSTKFPYEIIDVSQFLRITDGKMPVIFLLENGIVKKQYGYRDLNEEEILDFLTSIN